MIRLSGLFFFNLRIYVSLNVYKLIQQIKNLYFFHQSACTHNVGDKNQTEIIIGYM